MLVSSRLPSVLSSLATVLSNVWPLIVMPVAFRDAEHAAHLTARDLDADPGEEADQHGAREEVGEESEPEESGEQQEPAGHECDERWPARRTATMRSSPSRPGRPP